MPTTPKNAIKRFITFKNKTAFVLYALNKQKNKTIKNRQKYPVRLDVSNTSIISTFLTHYIGHFLLSVAAGFITAAFWAKIA